MGRSKLAKSNTNSIAHDLNETNVQTIFNKCLANENTKTQTKAILFPMLFGYKLVDGILFPSCISFN